MLKYINIKVIIISFIIGLIYIYISDDYKKIIYMYPTPDNVDTLQYKDKTDHCFQFSAKLVNCDNTSKHIPVQ